MPPRPDRKTTLADRQHQAVDSIKTPTAPAKTPTAPAADQVPHIWHTTDSDGGDCRHLAMGEEGAIQAHLLHHGMLAFNGDLKTVDEGRIGPNTERSDICFNPLCTLYGLIFPR